MSDQRTAETVSVTLAGKLIEVAACGPEGERGECLVHVSGDSYVKIEGLPLTTVRTLAKALYRHVQISVETIYD